MLDGEKINAAIRTGSMDDVGTRLQFLTELYELWQTGIDVLDRYDNHHIDYKEKRAELETACRMLFFHMTKDQPTFRDASIVNRIPERAEDIKDDENPATA